MTGIKINDWNNLLDNEHVTDMPLETEVYRISSLPKLHEDAFQTTEGLHNEETQQAWRT